MADYSRRVAKLTGEITRLTRLTRLTRVQKLTVEVNSLAAIRTRGVTATALPVIPAKDVLKALQKMAKGSKGQVVMRLIEQIFPLLDGWNIEEQTVFTLANGYSSDDKFEVGLGDKFKLIGINHIWSSSIKDPIKLGVTRGNDLEKAMQEFRKAVTIVPKSGPGGRATVGKMYSTEPYIGNSGHRFNVDRAWLGAPGWKVTTPRGSKTFARPNTRRGFVDPNDMKLAAFWTFVYKHGLQKFAQAVLDSFDSEDVAVAIAPKSKQMIPRREFSREVEKVLKTIVDKKHKEVTASIQKQALGALDRYLDTVKASIDQQKAEGNKYPSFSDYRYFKDNPFDQGSQRVIYKMTEPAGRGPGQDYRVRAKGYKSEAEKYAKDVAEQIRDGFTGKNTMKLSRIVNGKGNLKNSKILNIARGPDYGGDIQFNFDDGSSFVVRNKTVIKRSILGKWFAQYPTTFHQVVMPDGSKMSGVSEKKMLEEFAGVSAR